MKTYCTIQIIEIFILPSFSEILLTVHFLYVLVSPLGDQPISTKNLIIIITYTMHNHTYSTKTLTPSSGNVI